MVVNRAAAGLSAVAAAVVLLVVGASASGGANTRGHVSPGRGASRGFALALAVPSAGDVSYGVTQVRIAPGSRALVLPRATGAQRVFAGRVGGLSMSARSPSWRSLRASVRVYVVVWRVASAGARVRDVAFVVLRRRTGTASDRSAGGTVDFLISDAQAAVGSFWVRGVDRRGYANVFHVRNMLATALGNWNRYLQVLRAAHAFAAALHPFVRTAGLVTAPRPRAQGHGPLVWTGGQRPSARVRGIFRLLLATVRHPDAWAGAKDNLLVPDFIAHELGNPGLAERWTAITTKLPLKVPDRYAAGAQEEARFARIRSPRISSARVAIDDAGNSSSMMAAQAPAPPSSIVTLSVISGGGGSGRVDSSIGGIDCSATLSEQLSGARGCVAALPLGSLVTLTATADSGFGFTGWQASPAQSGCGASSGTACSLLLQQDSEVTATFEPANSLTVSEVGAGRGTVVSSPAGIDCGSTCTAVFAAGQTVTLTATPAAGYVFAGWSGCTLSMGASCGVTIPSAGASTVTARFEPSSSITVTKNGVGSGTVASSPFGIDCGGTCSAGFRGGTLVTLVATPDPGSRLDRWSGCDGIDSSGDCYLTTSSSLRTITATFRFTSTMTRIAGDGTRCSTAPSCGDGGPATGAQLNTPNGVAVDSGGDVYIADSGDHEVRRVSPDGTIDIVAGNGNQCKTAPRCGDNGAGSTAELAYPDGVAVDSSTDDLYIADSFDHEIRKVAANGTITRFAGSGLPCSTPPNCGDSGAAGSAQLSYPQGVAVDANGNVYIADTGDNEVRKVAADGTITRFAGTGAPCVTAPSCGDNGPATGAQLNSPAGVAIDPNGNVYIADTGDDEVRRVSADGTITRIAGNGSACTSTPDCGDNGLATSAQLNSPGAVALDSKGNVDIADTGDQEIRQVAPNGTITTIVGNGDICIAPPSCGDAGAATSAQLGDPGGIAIGPESALAQTTGVLYIADTIDNEVRSTG
jgi:sugar lactone lactonase YvrE